MSKQEFSAEVLHISDFHFKDGTQYDRDIVLEAFLRSLPDITKRSGPIQLVIASGDIAFSGKTAEYDAASMFFDKLLEKLNLTKRSLFVVPGNHDVDRTKGRALKGTLFSEQEADEYFDPKEELLHVSVRQSAFKVWFDKYFTGIRTFPTNTTALEIETVVINGLNIDVLCLNSAVFCSGDEDSGKLWLGRRCISEPANKVKSSSADIKIAVLHHPFSWLAQGEVSNIKGAIRDSSDIIMTGHLHESDVEDVAGVIGKAIHLSAGALYQTRKWPNRALIVTVSVDQFKILPIRYEDKPTEVWTVDTSLFHNEIDFVKKYSRTQSHTPARIDNTSNSTGLVSELGVLPNQAEKHENKRSSQENVSKHAEYTQDLFTGTNGKILYVPPRLNKIPQSMQSETNGEDEQISLNEIVSSSASFFIESRSEYGGTTLCKNLSFLFKEKGNSTVFLKNARELPNYKKKLEIEFYIRAKSESDQSVLILDDYDFDRDERLMKEIIALNVFDRIIAITVNRSLGALNSTAPTDFGLHFDMIYLWGIGRADIRALAEAVFYTGDEFFLTTVVDKVYQDLLGLCIPLTPLNVIMYLQILHREGEFHPLNRVELVGRYLQELLRRPSDAYSDMFNSKNKIDVISAFSYRLFAEEKFTFNENFWHEFVKEYQSNTLSDFDERSLLNEIIESKIVMKRGGDLFFRYSFYFVYFLGKYISSRNSALDSFLENREYLRITGLVDAITGISSDNSKMIVSLNARMKVLLDEFSTKYVKPNFDPLLGAIWPDNEEGDKKLWNSIEKQIEAGQRSTQEIDVLKTSLLAEARTVDQQVQFDKFHELETELFTVSSVLISAFKNSDDVSGRLKLDALAMISQSNLVAFQIGSIFAHIIARRRHFQWGGIAFIDFDMGRDLTTEVTPEERLSVIVSLSRAVLGQASAEIGVHKLMPVYSKVAEKTQDSPFLELLLFKTALISRGKNWDNVIESMIKRTDKNSFVLGEMLRYLTRTLSVEVIQHKDREKIKRLIATVQAKRRLNKNRPGSKLISRVLGRMEKSNYFDPDEQNSSQTDPKD